MVGRLVDLSQPFYEGMPRAGLFPPPSIRTLLHAEQDPVNVLEYRFVTHIGTHVDAPLHLYRSGKTIDEYPVERFAGPAIVLDIPAEPLSPIDADHLRRAPGEVRTGDIVLLRTGWGAKYGEDAYHDHPYLTDDAAAWLIERQVPMLGVDFITPEKPYRLRDASFDFPIHRTLLSHDVLIIEHLNLEPVAGKRVTLYAFPLKIQAADGGPARVVAALDDHEA